ncbi:thiamine phosphate synthase [Bacillus thermotolerans]|uniref:thiamine phosphate synthase n=1 Tax=Bacillus thermotolerans TaxID=1221996 RepID=UPI0005895AF8|nr:thiamine phosphate synthase [Bacillus thermotolerans]KKB41585.1 Thiamin-phosphate pyrophosphorylase [Bacillus thermotolerans]
MSRISEQQTREALAVYFIMGSTNCLQDPVKTLEEAIKGGITLFQFREKGPGALTDKAKEALALKLQEVCRRHGVPFLVNDDIELAAAIQADGVHIGQEDEPLEAVRARFPDKIIGVSAHTLEEAGQAAADGADYLGMGPVFPTSTKPDAKAARGTELIKAVRRSGLQLPIVGIGGITPANARIVVEDGADGVSVITAISQASSPLQAAHELKRAVEDAHVR